MEKTPLHPIERKVLASLTDAPKVFDALVSSSGLLPDQVRRSISWLSSKALVTTTEVTSVELSLSGLPPELVFLESLREGGGEASVALPQERRSGRTAASPPRWGAPSPRGGWR